MLLLQREHKIGRIFVWLNAAEEYGPCGVKALENKMWSQQSVTCYLSDMIY